ncbi:MAG TPA: methylmalonyl-CoA mutase subunit beta [Pseudolabrys sp.]|nr:methylmalonyl-CoA mutase subunit beta [Pseudolabrys sp.]
MDEELPLAAEFPATIQAEWRKLVDAALKGASFEKRLTIQTYDGLRIEPLYPRAVGARPVAGRTPGAVWTLMQRVDHPDPAAANAQALQDLENGATGLTLVMAGSVSANGYGLDASPATLARVLDSVALDAITIDFNLSPPTRSAVQHFAALVKMRKIAPAAVDLRASINPIGGFAASGASPKPWSALSKNFSAMVRELADQGFRGPFAVADGRIIHNAGGSEAQELSFAIASAVEYLRALEANGVPLDAARGIIYFRMSADADEFLTIAKFRSLRKLWARVENACGLAPKPAYVAAETAWRMMTQRDPYVNLLRMTIAVTAAGVGGADSITVLPHTAALGLPDAFARRVARNTQLILLEESNLARVSDPAAGSGAIEDLTIKLCAAAWAQFQEIESTGGAWAALENGLVQKHVAAVRAERQKAAARRKDALTGTSDFPDLHEKSAAVLDVAPVVPPKEAAAAVTIEPLPRIRLAEPFEALRDKSDQILAKTGARPKVFLANLGRLSEFTARAMFAKNFYEAGGIEALSNDGFKDQAAMIAAFKTSGAKLACLCSSDAVYAAQAAEAAKVLNTAGATVHLAGRPGENEANWRQAGVKTFIFMGCDAVSTLEVAHDILAVK